MNRELISTGILLTALSFNASAETIEYLYSGVDNSDCKGQLHKDDSMENRMEKKRREIIIENKLPKDLQWMSGEIKNDWGDNKGSFCYLAHNGKAYILDKNKLFPFFGIEIRNITR